MSCRRKKEPADETVSRLIVLERAAVFKAAGAGKRRLQQRYPRRDTKDHEGPPSETALPHRHGLRPGKPAHAPLRSKSDGRRPTRERGRPARMLSRSVPLSFPAMRHPATLPAGTAWARPKQSPGAVAGRLGWRRWPRLCQDLCGRDARAPGWASSRDVVSAKEAHRSSCLFVLRPQQQSSVSPSNDPPVVGGGGAACLIHFGESGRLTSPSSVNPYSLQLRLGVKPNRRRLFSMEMKGDAGSRRP